MSDPVRSNCPLCMVIDDVGNPAVHADSYIVAFPALRRPASGSAQYVVATRAHIRSLADLPANLYGPLLRVLATVAAGVEEAFAAPVAIIHDPTIEPQVQHLHFAIEPRRQRDSDGQMQRVDDYERAEHAKLLRHALRHHRDGGDES